MSLWAPPLLLLSLLTLVVVWLLLRVRKKAQLPIRPLSAFQDLKIQTGYAAESGGAIHIALGNGNLYQDDAITSLAGLQVLESLADETASYNAPPIVTVGDPTLLPLAQDILRRAYERRGRPELYDASTVRFIAPSPVAYAAGAGDVVTNANVIAGIAIGAFGSEVSLISDASARHDIPQLAAVPASAAISALYPATDRLAQGEELYAAGAQLTEERPYVAGLVTQDILRVLVAVAILALSVAAFLRIW